MIELFEVEEARKSNVDLTAKTAPLTGCLPRQCSEARKALISLTPVLHPPASSLALESLSISSPLQTRHVF